MHFSLWGVRASVALLLTVVGPGLAVLGVGKGVDSPAPSPSLSALGPPAGGAASLTYCTPAGDNLGEGYSLNVSSPLNLSCLTHSGGGGV